MNHQLIWNFEFTLNKSPCSFNDSENKEDIKWEARFFWPSHEKIVMSCLDHELLDLKNYKKKIRDDYYYLIPNSDANIKLRKNQLLYKPLVRKTNTAYGFGPKIILNPFTPAYEQNEHCLKMNEILNEVTPIKKPIHVKKIAYLYKFQCTPTIKLELARLKINKKTFYSACIEGHSLKKVNFLVEHLLGHQISCDYVTFLRNILKS